MNKLKLRNIAIVLALVFSGTASGQGVDIPVPSTPGGWVNDYAKVFSAAENQALTQKLNAFQYRSSTQIFVVTINENNGYPVDMLAAEIGHAWGVGQDGKDNGLLILLDMEDRDVQIATGYGLEEYVPDAIAKRIIEAEIVPNFKQGNFYGGVDQATDVLIDLLDGKFTPDEYDAQASGGSAVGSAIGTLFFIIFWFFIIFGSRRRRSAGIGGRSNLPFWIALGMMSGGRSSGSFNNFSSGSGGFGGGGGFGGFTGGGGGGFGGGGAGGSW